MTRPEKVFRLVVLLALLLVQVGCATTDADLDYTRQKPPDPASGDPSWHGWNSANN